MEKIKAVIEFYKTLFLISITTLLSIFGYFFIHINGLKEINAFVLLYGIILFSGLSIFF